MDLGGGRSSPVEYVVIDETPPADLFGDRMEGEILNFFSEYQLVAQSLCVSSYALLLYSVVC